MSPLDTIAQQVQRRFAGSRIVIWCDPASVFNTWGAEAFLDFLRQRSFAELDS